jgi:hypothetical protein
VFDANGPGLAYRIGESLDAARMGLKELHSCQAGRNRTKEKRGREIVENTIQDIAEHLRTKP